jgi:hypothetical protein
MWLVTIVPLLAALGAAFLAWRHASRLDELSMNQAWPSEQEDKSIAIALAAVVAAVAAAMVLQLALLSRVAAAG